MHQFSRSSSEYACYHYISLRAIALRRPSGVEDTFRIAAEQATATVIG